MILRTACVIALTLAAATGNAAAALNGAFEAGADAPEGWSVSEEPGVSGARTSAAARHGAYGVEAAATDPKAVWTSSPVTLERGSAIVEGWVRAPEGEAWLEVDLRDGAGKSIKRLSAPHVQQASDWTYTAVETGVNAEAAVVELWVKGGQASFDDVRVVPASPNQLSNADFEKPLDDKGRIAFWDAYGEGDLLEGRAEGAASVDANAPAAGAQSAVVTATGDWFSVASIPFPVPPYADHVQIRARARCAPGSEVRLIAVWVDPAQQVMGREVGPAAAPEGWQELSLGPLAIPEGAFSVRTVLAVRKQSAEAGEAKAWFDDAKLRGVVREKRVRVLVNQVGYDAPGPKAVMVMTNFFPESPAPASVEIVGPGGSTRVDLTCRGRIYGQNEADWGWYFWRGDFSDVRAKGRYTARASVGGATGESHPFEVGEDVLFRATTPRGVDFFFVQRCGGEVPGWHAPCHLDDAKLPDGTHRDLVGGWHSAGDYNKLSYEWGDGGAMYALVNAAEAAPDFLAGFDRDKDGLPDVLAEAKWGADFMRKIQRDDGGLLGHIEQGPDRRTWMNWVPPEKTTDNTVGTADDPIVRPEPGSSPFAIGGWVRLAKILESRGIENDYRDRALRLWEHATQGGTAGPNPFLLIATVDLFRATGEEQHLAFARKSAEGILASGSPDGPLPGGYADSGDFPAAALAYFALELPDEPLVPAIKERLTVHLPHMLAEPDNPFGIGRQKTGPDGYFFEPTSTLGRNNEFFSRAWSAMLMYRLLGDRAAWAYALDQINFVLGMNPYDLCMFEGAGTVNPPRYHHRYITMPGHERGAVPGAVPNGFVRDIASNDRPGFDLSTGGRPYPSYRTSEPWLVHNVIGMLAFTALHEAEE